MHILMSMANNPSTPYFVRFARVYNAEELKLDFLMLCKEEPTLGEEVGIYECDVYWIKFGDKNKLASYLLAIKNGIKLLKKIKPDILHVHLFDDAIPLLIAANIVGIKHKVITKLDAGYHINNKPSFIKFDKWNNKLSDHLICVSEENKLLVHKKENAPLNKISLVHQGFPIDEVIGNEPNVQAELRSRFEIKEQKVVVAIGRFIPLKGYDYLIEAISLLKGRESNDLRVIFVGYGNHQKNYEKKVNDLGLNDVIHFSDWISRCELNNLYQIADIFIHGALIEPFGFVIAEAMANKTPIVSSQVGAAKDAITHLESGYLVPPANSNEIAKGINYILNNDTKKMVSNAFEKVNQMFTIEAMWDGHYEVYKKLIK